MKKLFFLGALLSASVASFALPNAAAPVPGWPAAQVMAVYSDSYDVSPNWGYLEGWGQTTTLTPSEIDGNHYLAYSNFNYLGWGCAASLNVMTMEKLHLDIWADEDGKIGIVPIYGGAGLTTDDNQRVIVDLVGGKWNSFDLDLAVDFPKLNLSSIFQFKFDNGTIAAFALDNVFFFRTTALSDTEAPTDFMAEIQSADFFSIAIKAKAKDNEGIVNYEVFRGEEKVGNGAGKSDELVVITINNLEPGKEYEFTVVASDPTGNKTPANTVSTSTLVAPAPAPAPAHAAANVKSLFSNAYEPATAVGNYCEWWWQSPVCAQRQLEGNDVLYYVSSQDGVFGWAFGETDFTGFQKVHVSVYPTSAFTFEVYPVIAGEPHKVSAEMKANEWNDVVFDYTEYESFNMKQFGFANRANTSFFLDNLYFFKDAAEGVNNVQSDKVQCTKVIENGQVIIIRNGVRYNVQGAEVR